VCEALNSSERKQSPQCIRRLMCAAWGLACVVAGGDNSDALWWCLDTGLRLLHPLMPFVTEELWQRLPRREADLEEVPSIMVASYPEATSHWADNALEEQMTLIMDLVKCLRSERAKCVLSAPHTRAESSPARWLPNQTSPFCLSIPHHASSAAPPYRRYSAPSAWHSPLCHTIVTSDLAGIHSIFPAWSAWL
jgi:hypothetical protein